MRKRIFYLCFLGSMFLTSLSGAEMWGAVGKMEADTSMKPRNNVYKGFSGGMFYHVGYAKSGDFDIFGSDGNLLGKTLVEGACMGIGGTLRFHLGRYFFVGAEGYSSTLAYGDKHSTYKIGWGGITWGMRFDFKKVAPFFGLTVGGGAATHTHFAETSQGGDFSVVNTVMYRKNGLMLLNPFIGVEYAVHSKIRLVFKMDALSNLTYQKDYPWGFRAYIGVLFFRWN